MKKVRFLYNPSSGENAIAGVLDQIVAVHQRHGYELMPYRLSFAQGQSGQVIEILREGCNHLLVAGGDGTVNYVVNLLKNNDIDLPIAVLPTGTANDFAMLLDMPTDPLDACEKLLTGRMRDIDLGVVNGVYFANVFSCGLFTDISQRTPTIIKNNFGKLAYYVGGLGELPKLRRMQLKVTSDGGDFEGQTLIFFVFNGRTAGNLRLAYLSSVDDGLLDVLIVKGDNPTATLRTFFHYLSLPRNPKEYPPGIVHIQCTRLQATSTNSESTDIDGQPGPKFPLEIECRKGALRVLVPAKNPKKIR